MILSKAGSLRDVARLAVFEHGLQIVPLDAPIESFRLSLGLQFMIAIKSGVIKTFSYAVVSSRSVMNALVKVRFGA